MNSETSSRHSELRESPENNQLNTVRQKKKNQMSRSKGGNIPANSFR